MKTNSETCLDINAFQHFWGYHVLGYLISIEVFTFKTQVKTVK
jgi:hypothetical protein